MLKRIEERGSFWTTGSDGNRHRVRWFVEVLDAATMEDPGGEMDGLIRLRTDDGHAVNKVRGRHGEYFVPALQLELSTDDPDAP